MTLVNRKIATIRCTNAISPMAIFAFESNETKKQRFYDVLFAETVVTQKRIANSKGTLKAVIPAGLNHQQVCLKLDEIYA